MTAVFDSTDDGMGTPGRNAAALGRACLAAAALLAGCEAPARPAVGVATSARFADAARLAVEDAAARGLALSFDTIVDQESSTHAAPALRTARELVSVPGLAAVVGHSNSAASLAASQVYNEGQVVQISPTATATVYSDAGPYSFRLVPPDEDQGRFLAELLRDSVPEGARIAVLYVNDDYGRGLRAAVLDALDFLRVRRDIVYDMPHTEDLHASPDMAHHLVSGLTAARPDAILWLGRVAALGVVLPRIRDRLGDVPIIGSDGVAPGIPLDGPTGHWRAVRYVDFVDMSSTARIRGFASRYRARFGLPATGADALTYDAMGILLEAVRAGASTGPEIRGYLHSLGRNRPPYEGVTGPIQFDEDGNVRRSYHVGWTGLADDRSEERAGS